MIKTLLDTNIILDIALLREPYFKSASGIFEKIDDRRIAGYITATTVTDIYYIVRKKLGRDKAIDFINNLLTVLDIIGVDKLVVLSAINSPFKDFEDGIQHFCAVLNELDFIITRNKDDFKESVLPVFTPEEFLEYLTKVNI
jgi:predicted nucleic acid-binding protein